MANCYIYYSEYCKIADFTFGKLAYPLYLFEYDLVKHSMLTVASSYSDLIF